MLWYCNKIYHRAKAIVFQNKYEQSCFSESLKSKGVVIPNPVQVSRTKGNEGSDAVIATAGRLNRQKNHFMLIDAMKIVCEKHSQVKCRIYGEGDLRNDLQDYIYSRDLANVVTLEGNHTDIHEKLAECSVFVMTSEFEGLSNALIEAMMIGLACISTDYPGASELIQSGKNGIIVERKDSEALASQIVALIDDPSERNRLAKAATESSKSYRAEVVLEKWRCVIN